MKLFLRILLAFFCVVLTFKSNCKTIYFRASFSLFEKQERDDCNRFFYRLRNKLKSMGYSCVHIPDNELVKIKPAQDDRLVVFDLYGDVNYLISKSHFAKEQRILYLFESPMIISGNYNVDMHKMFNTVYTWDDDLVDNKKYFKFYYVYNDWNALVDIPSFSNRKLLSMFTGNGVSNHPGELYSMRKKAISVLEGIKESDFDFYGKGWSRQHYKNYQGFASNKVQALVKYKFSICFENCCKYNGYITEKIFDCFMAGTIPVYWGPSNIDKYIPANCYINGADFADDFKSLYDYLNSLDDIECCKYLQNINLFMNSDKIQPFSSQNFISNFVKSVI